jgi:hypothetical protein
VRAEQPAAVVKDNVQGGVQVQVQVKVNERSGSAL